MLFSIKQTCFLIYLILVERANKTETLKEKLKQDTEEEDEVDDREEAEGVLPV